MAIEEIVKLLSAFGIGTIVSAAFVFMQSSKRNQLDYITKERSEWRKDVKKIIVCLLSEDEEKKSLAVNRVKTLINAYGQNQKYKYTKKYYMNDGHIWDLLEEFDNSEEGTNRLTTYLALLVKYDWERSKEAARYNFYNLSAKIANLIFLVAILVVLIRDASEQANWQGWTQLFLSFDIITFLILIFQNNVIEIWRDNQTVRKSSFGKWFAIIIGLPYIYAIGRLLWPNQIGFIIATLVVLFTEFVLLNELNSVDDDYIQKIIGLSNTEETDEELKAIVNEVNWLENRIIYRNYSIIGAKAPIERAKELRSKTIKRLRKETRPNYYYFKQFCKIIRQPWHSIKQRVLRRKRKLKRRT